MSLAEMKNFAQQIVGTPELIEYDYNHPVAVVEYRDGSINDVIYKTKVNNE